MKNSENVWSIKLLFTKVTSKNIICGEVGCCKQNVSDGKFYKSGNNVNNNCDLAQICMHIPKNEQNK